MVAMKPTLIVLIAITIAATLFRAEAADRFQLRARVTKIEDHEPAATQEFNVGYGGASTKTKGNHWSAWLSCTEKMWGNLRRDYEQDNDILRKGIRRHKARIRKLEAEYDQTVMAEREKRRRQILRWRQTPLWKVGWQRLLALVDSEREG